MLAIMMHSIPKMLRDSSILQDYLYFDITDRLHSALLHKARYVTGNFDETGAGLGHGLALKSTLASLR